MKLPNSVRNVIAKFGENLSLAFYDGQNWRDALPRINASGTFDNRLIATPDSWAELIEPPTL